MTVSRPWLEERACCDIDLTALLHNYNTLTSMLRGDAKLWPVIKADAYGHGAVRIAHVLEDLGVARVCVAALSEAAELRHAGVGVPMLIMGPLQAEELRTAAKLSVSATVLSMSMLESLEKIAAERAMGADPLRVHLKINTGMGRWGLPQKEVPSVMDRLDRLVRKGGIRIEGVMTHFATADAKDTNFFEKQLAEFQDVAYKIRSRYPEVIVHAANSAATILRPRSHFDAVRCGIALYGLSPTQTDPAEDGLLPVMSLTSHVADIRILRAGDSVGYGRTFVADRTTRVALVPVGYADGIRRALSGCGEALIRGKNCEYAGVVSMDHLSLLVESTVKVGDRVTLLGSDKNEQILAEKHARFANTINYEITCGIAAEPRLTRRYVTATAKDSGSLEATPAQ